MRPGLARIDRGLERHAWLVLSLAVTICALGQWWVAARFWTGDYEREVQVARLFAAVLSAVAAIFAGVHALRFLPFAQAIPTAARWLLRWLVGAAVATAGAISLVIVMMGGPTLRALHLASASLLILGGLNLFPRRLPSPDGPSTPSR